MKLKKAKDGITKVAVFMITEAGEISTGVTAGTFVTVPKKGLYDILSDMISDIDSYSDIDLFYQEGIDSEWFTTKEIAEKELDYTCNIMSEYKDCDIKYMMMPVEVLYMNLKTKKAHDSTPTNLIIENKGVYLLDYKDFISANKEYIRDVKWTKNQDEAILFDDSGAAWILKLLQDNLRNMEQAKITKIEVDESILDAKTMYAVKLLVNDQDAGYLFCENTDCQITENIHDASWYSDADYRKVWKTKVLNAALNDLMMDDDNINAAELKKEELGVFSHEFLKYYNKGAKTVNQAQKMWEAEHGKSEV